MKKIISLILFFTIIAIKVKGQSICPNVFKCGDTLVDSRDGYKYPTVQIGTQCWFQVNLQAIRYINGDSINHITNGTTWGNLTTGAWCDYSNASSNGVIFGHLYNWYAAKDRRSICPMGWYVPSENEMNILLTFLGGTANIGGALMSTSTLWNSGGVTRTNSSGFTALPSGNRYSDGTFSWLFWCTNFWSSSVYNTSDSWYFYLCFCYSYADLTTYPNTTGWSIRCVREY